MHTILIKFILASFFISLFNISLISQEQTQQEEKPPEPVTYSLIEIPTKIEEVSIYFQSLAEIVKPSPSIAEIDSLFETYLSTKEELEKEVDLDKPENFFTRKLEDLKQRWEKLDKKVTDWQTVIGERAKELEVEKKKVDETIGIWKRTYDNARTEKGPKELLQSVNDIQTELKKFQREIAKIITKDLKIQSNLADENIELGVRVSKLNDILKNRRQEIFSQDAAPLWEAIFESKDTVSITSQVGDIWGLYKRSASEFIELNRKNLSLDFILLIIALLFVYGLKFFSKKLDKGDEAVGLAFKILERPISITILLFLIFLVLVYPDIPEVLRSLMAIIVLMPLLRILFNISDKSLHVPLIGIAVLFILSEIQSISLTESLLERILLLFLTILAISGLAWLIQKKILQRAFEGKKGNNLIIFGTRVAATLLVASLLMNILGYVRLAELLVTGTLSSTFAVILLVTAYLVIIALMVLFLQTKIARKLRVVQKHPEKIKITTSKIIRIGATVWLTIGILNNFELKEAVEEWLINAFIKDWAIGTFSLSIGDILLFFVTIWITVSLARLIRFFLEEDILSRMTLPRGVPGAVSAIVKYIIVGFGIVVAFTAAGLDLDKFTLLAGALGVGIGFGMQDLVNNFVSGLILIFERPIQVGDAVSVADISGRVQSIGIRSSIIRNWSGADVIVPNGHLISNKLTNWTMSDQLRRLELKVGAKYGSDVEKVMEVLLGCAKEHQHILVSPAPYVLFTDFGDSHLEFELRCWTSNYGAWIDIRSEINVAIDKAFKKEGIEIPYPQRDLHIVSDFTKDKEQMEEQKEKRGKGSSVKKDEKKMDNKVVKKDKNEDEHTTRKKRLGTDEVKDINENDDNGEG
jgi:small-conductance mechanosensitive channel